MKRHMCSVVLALVAYICSFIGPVTAYACTGILGRAEDGSCVFARTLEFGTDFVSYDLIIVPREYAYRGQTPSGEPGLAWKTEYAHVGFNPFGQPLVGDGINEKGLACGAFFFPGYAGYQDVQEEDLSEAISCLDLVSWILGTCANVADVRERLPGIKVTGVKIPEWGFVPPLHYMVADSTGDAAIIEYVGGQLNIHDNEVNVITNSPDYVWHTTNLRNYIGLRPGNDPSVKINTLELEQFGQGTGAIGLPGDFSSPSRFVRAVFFTSTACPGKDADEEVGNAFRILNQFDIPKGSVRGEEAGKKMYDTTQWTSAADLSGLRYFYHTYNDRSVRVVDMKELDLNAKDIKTIKDVQEPGSARDVSHKFK
ncbi:MAG: choloylglycine hydrolase family protein [Candidatus Omnitrophica bacterium]|nr:choloylglycine hydrolase family protein [Candidatus Omnitrophota bacterium]MDD5488502.1 choloylglycine hydrolase family protein [Candidatus Omnitrophota bacterium]